MPAAHFLIIECQDPDCRFRFPANRNHTLDRCPLCSSPARVAVPSFLNQPDPKPVHRQLPLEISGILDNLRSAYNVGSIFRTADGVGASHLYLCGITPTPDNLRVGKTSLGAENTVPWSHHKNAVDLAETLREKGYHLIAIENRDEAELISGEVDLPLDKPLGLVVGNELSGIDPGLVSICDQNLALPMRGEKSSLNVTVAFGASAYLIRYIMSTIRYGSGLSI